MTVKISVVQALGTSELKPEPTPSVAHYVTSLKVLEFMPYSEITGLEWK
jgi:hypothetical protein